MKAGLQAAKTLLKSTATSDASHSQQVYEWLLDDPAEGLRMAKRELQLERSSAQWVHGDKTTLDALEAEVARWARVVRRRSISKETKADRVKRLRAYLPKRR